MTLAWFEAALSRAHDRASFSCGEPALDEHLKKYARQNHDSGGAKCFVACEVGKPATILGYYTLSLATVEIDRTPQALRRGLGKYDVPMFRVGRLAVGLAQQGRGLGAALFYAAGKRCVAVASEVGGVALLIDAKSERTAIWYVGLGGLRLEHAPLTLVLPLKVIAGLLTPK